VKRWSVDGGQSSEKELTTGD